MLAWLLLNLLTILAAIRLTSVTTGAGRAAQVVAFGQYWSALLIGSMLLAGGLHRLTVNSLCVMQTAILAVTWLATRRRPARPLVGFARSIADGWHLMKTDPLLAAASTVVVAAYFYVIVIGLLFPPATGDELLYHLPLALSFVQQADLQVPVLSGFWKANLWANYPANGSLLMAWILLSGSDRIVDMVQLPFVVFGAAAVFAIGRRLGQSRRHAAWSALLFASMPLVINQAKASMNDVILAFFVLASLYWIVAYQPGKAWRYGLLAGIPMGLAFGVKNSAAGHLVLLAIVAASLELGRGSPWRLQRWSEICIRTVVALSCLALLGGYWYLRNYFLMGSATYPLGLLSEITPHADRFPKVISFLQVLFHDAVRVPAGYNTYNVNYGIGVQTLAWVFPAAGFVAFRLRFRQHGSETILAAAVLAGFFAWWLVAPPDGTGRYALPWLALGFTIALRYISEITMTDRPWRLTALGMICISSALALPSIGSDLRGPAIINGLAHLRRTGSLPDPFVHRGDLAILDYRQAWKWLADHSRTSAIAVVNQAFTYPLFGKGAGWNRLYFVAPQSRDSWVRELRNHHIDYVVTSPLRMPVEDMKPIMTQWGARPILTHITDTPNSESSGMSMALSGVSASGVALRYLTLFQKPERGPLPPSGTFFLSVNGGRFIEPLAPSPILVPEAVPWQTAQINLPAGTAIHDIAVIYFDTPVTRLPIMASIIVGDASLLGSGRNDAPLSVGDWTLLTHPIEEDWMNQLPGTFQLIGAFDDVSPLSDRSGKAAMKIYKVVPEAARHEGGADDAG